MHPDPDVPNDSTSRPSKQPMRKVHVLRFLNINCQSIAKKSADLSALIEMYNPDIICGTESWLKSNINNSEIFPSNFTVFRKDRVTTTSGGGVFQAIKNDLVCNHRKDLDSSCEVIWSELNLKQCKPLIIGSYYRTQEDKNGDKVDELNASILKLGDQTNSSNLLLLGDFNLGNINWKTSSVDPNKSGSKSAAEKLISLSQDHNLNQLVTEPTRKDSILDLVFTNNSNIVKKVSVIDGISDHEAVLVDLDIKPNRKRKVKRKKYFVNKADTEAIEDHINKFSSEYFSNHSESSAEGKWSAIKTVSWKLWICLFPVV